MYSVFSARVIREIGISSLELTRLVNIVVSKLMVVELKYLTHSRKWYQWYAGIKTLQGIHTLGRYEVIS
jgi:hypothetical protein